MEKEPSESSDYRLYLAADQKLDRLKEQISEIFQRLNADKERIDRVQDRVDRGISVTGQQNAAKITELAVKINDLEHAMTSVKEISKNQEKVLGRIMAGLFWISFAGVLGGLIALAYQIMKVHLLGN